MRIGGIQYIWTVTGPHAPVRGAEAARAQALDRPICDSESKRKQKLCAYSTVYVRGVLSAEHYTALSYAPGFLPMVLVVPSGLVVPSLAAR